MGWGGGYKYIYPCICITAYSCWAVCSLGPTVLEAEGSALIGKGSLSSHSEGKVSGATAAPPRPAARTSCAALNAPDSATPPRPPRGCQSCSSCPSSKSGLKLQPWPLLVPRPKHGQCRCRGVAVPQFPHCPRPALCANSTIPARPPQRAPLSHPCLALASQVLAIKTDSKRI